MKKKTFLIQLVVLVLSFTSACNKPAPQEPLAIDEGAIATVVSTTLSAVPPPTLQITPTDTPIPTQTLPPTIVSPEPLDRANIESVLHWVSYAFAEKKPEMISQLIGNNGAEFGASYASSVAFPGFNNSELIVSELKSGLQNASPTCMGYSVTLHARPDKAGIYFSGIRFDQWENDITGFLFFYQDNGWELVAIAPIPEGQTWSNLYQTLWACP